MRGNVGDNVLSKNCCINILVLDSNIPYIDLENIVERWSYQKEVLLPRGLKSEIINESDFEHNNSIFVFSRIVNIDGKSGTVFLFDCDVLHAGRINKCKERKVIQYKICHKDDLEKLKSLSGVYKEKTEKCVDNIYGKINLND